MPKQTYNNLPKDKKERIFNAGVLEFSYHDVNEASVNTIVRIANISKGSFYQYFEDKNDYYWYIVMEIVYGQVGKYEELLKKNKGDFFKTEEDLFVLLLNMFDDKRYKNIVRNVYKTNYLDLKARISSRASMIYINMYDLLISYGFKGFNIRSKEDFIVVFDMVRNISNNAIMAMISDGLSKTATRELYNSQLEMLGKGIYKKGWFN